VKAQEVRTKVKKENVQSHMVGFGNLKENTDAAINTVLEGRTGKVKVFGARLKGISRKVFSRRRRKCPLDADHKLAANNALANATSIPQVEIALMEVLTARTSEIPPCRNIRKMIGRKVLKITKRLTNQTQ